MEMLPQSRDVDLFTLYQKNDGLHLTLKKTQGVISDIIHRQGQEIPFHVLFLKIPEDTYIDFNRKMKEQCSIFINALYSKVFNR